MLDQKHAYYFRENVTPIIQAAIAELDKNHCRVAKKFCQQMRYMLRNSGERFEPSSFHTMQYEFYAILRKHRSIVENHQNPDIVALFQDELLRNSARPAGGVLCDKHRR